MSATLEGEVDIAVIGAGFAGIGAAHELLRAGFDDLVVLEQAEDVGGCWRDNTYPGCQCDVPSSLYSFSFLPHDGWSRTYARRDEIHSYLRSSVTRLGLEPYLRLGTQVEEAVWDPQAARWRISTSRGELTARVLVSGAGPLTLPGVPELPGLGTFEGEVMHTAAWRADVDTAGRRVALVGTGASAIQVAPCLQPHVDRLVVFQRTPPWVLPHRDRPLRAVERAIYRRLPRLQRIQRAAAYLSREALAPGFTRNGWSLRLLEQLGRRNLRHGIRDRQLRQRLEPHYRAGCKRLLLSDSWYPTLGQPNVDVVTSAAARVTPRSLVAADGSEHDVDVIVFATGFDVDQPPIARRIRGADGRTLGDVWAGSPRAHRGTTVAGFPNLFLLVGPNTGLGHNSIVFMIESQVRYVRSALETMRRSGVEALEPRAEAQHEWNERVQRWMSRSVWTTGGCSSWYLDATGGNSTLWPATTLRYRWLTRRFDRSEYRAAAPAAQLAAQGTLPRSSG